MQYETECPDDWKINEVTVDEDLFKNCKEYGNII